MDALAARVFNSFMYCLFVLSNISFRCCLIVAMRARIFDYFMYRAFVSSITVFCSCLMVALPTWVFESFMYCPFVFSKISFRCGLMIALCARMHCPYVLCKTSLCKLLDDYIARKDIWLLHVLTKIYFHSCFMVTLAARIFDSFIFSPFALSKISFWCCLIVVIYARIFDSFVMILATFKFIGTFIQSWQLIFLVFSNREHLNYVGKYFCRRNAYQLRGKYILEVVEIKMVGKGTF